MTFCFQGREEKIPNAKCWYPHVVVYDPIKSGSIDGTDVQPHDNAIFRAVNSSYKPSYKALGNPLHTIFVGRLSMDTKEADLENEFCRYGKMIALRLVKDVVTGMSKRYAFIEYETYKMALNAYARCKSLVIKNSEVFVDFECGRILPGWKPRRLGGGFGGEKQSGQLRFGGRMRNFRQPLNLVEFRSSKNPKDENKEIISKTSNSSSKRSYSNSNDISTLHSSSTRRQCSSSKNISTTGSSLTRRPYSSSNEFSTTHSSSTRKSYSNSKNIDTSCSSSSKKQYSSSSNTSTVRSSSTKRTYSNLNEFSTTNSSSARRQNSISYNNSTAHSPSTRRPHPNCMSPTPGPSTISLPLTPPSNATIVLPLTPPSHSSIVLPLTPPLQSIIVLPLTPPSNSTVNLPLTPPSQSSVPLPLTPPLNLDAPPHNFR